MCHVFLISLGLSGHSLLMCIRWIVISPVDSAIYLLNNRGQLTIDEHVAILGGVVILL